MMYIKLKILNNNKYINTIRNIILVCQRLIEQNIKIYEFYISNISPCKILNIRKFISKSKVRNNILNRIVYIIETIILSQKYIECILDEIKFDI